LERLPLLERLDLSNNHLRQLPKRLFETISITDLNLSNNLLQEISDDISSLKNLETLDLRINQLIQLPEKALLSLKKLKSIRVGGNPLENHHVQLKELCEKLDFDEETSIQRE
jgi:Leucine-rich repeat (LRR) protein